MSEAPKHLRILIPEEDPSDAELLLRELRRANLGEKIGEMDTK